jgi:curli biogenesis system outer membrane secretion channel CsgG
MGLEQLKVAEKNASASKWLIIMCVTALSSCSLIAPGTMTSRSVNAELVKGPPIEDVVTPFDAALACLRGKVKPGVAFAVGQIVDATGKETFADGGTGKFITQGAGEMVQSALFRAGVTVVNRRDPNIMIVETQWGIRDLSQQMPVNFYISGSINSLDFIPGGGFSAQVGGAGPRMRQNRILIALDLNMTDAMTGRIVASVPLQKQIFSRELGASLGRFFGETLVSLDVGGQEREAVHFALRQMLSFATFELLGQVMNFAAFEPCKQLVSPFYGNIVNIGTGEPEALRIAQESNASQQAALRQQPGNAPRQSPARQQTTAARSIEEQVKELANHVMVFGARAVAAAEESLAAQSVDVAAQKSAEATELLRGAVQILQRAAELGLNGPEGDAAALVVERAMVVVGEAQQSLAARVERSRINPDSNLNPPAPAPTVDGVGNAPTPVTPPSAPRPDTPDAQRMGLTE